jgi:hypothetical protein
MTPAQAADQVSELTNVMNAYWLYLEKDTRTLSAIALSILLAWPILREEGCEPASGQRLPDSPPPSDAKLEKIKSWRDWNQKSLRGFWQKQSL